MAAITKSSSPTNAKIKAAAAPGVRIAWSADEVTYHIFNRSAYEVVIFDRYIIVHGLTRSFTKHVPMKDGPDIREIYIVDSKDSSTSGVKYTPPPSGAIAHPEYVAHINANGAICKVLVRSFYTNHTFVRHRLVCGYENQEFLNGLHSYAKHVGITGTTDTKAEITFLDIGEYGLVSEVVSSPNGTKTTVFPSAMSPTHVTLEVGIGSKIKLGCDFYKPSFSTPYAGADKDHPLVSLSIQVALHARIVPSKSRGKATNHTWFTKKLTTRTTVASILRGIHVSDNVSIRCLSSPLKPDEIPKLSSIGLDHGATVTRGYGTENCGIRIDREAAPKDATDGKDDDDVVEVEAEDAEPATKADGSGNAAVSGDKRAPSSRDGNGNDDATAKEIAQLEAKLKRLKKSHAGNGGDGSDSDKTETRLNPGKTDE